MIRIILHKIFNALTLTAAMVVATNALAQPSQGGNGPGHGMGPGMMGGNGPGWMGGYGAGWMGGYGGIWLLILLVIVVAGLVAWVVKNKGK
jgi:hypothetical protein